MATTDTEACDHTTAFARGANRVELRGLAPKPLIDVFDAVSFARQIDRMELVIEVLQEWADKKVHESNLIQRITQNNPQGSESVGGKR